MGKTVASQTKSLTVSEQMEIYVAIIIERYGQGHRATCKELKNEAFERYGIKVQPSDYCYNRWNKGTPVDWPCFFEYIGRAEYLVWGKDYPFNGKVIAKPKGGEEHTIGYCINGRRVIGKLPIYPDELPDDSPEYLEGKKTTVTVNIYERNPAARQACIDKYGAICYICEFDFGKVYGKEFEGMIHVHHLEMVSKSDGEYIIDPEKDLRPVCPNCHMVLHSKKDGYDIGEVKNMLK